MDSLQEPLCGLATFQELRKLLLRPLTSLYSCGSKSCKQVPPGTPCLYEVRLTQTSDTKGSVAVSGCKNLLSVARSIRRPRLAQLETDPISLTLSGLHHASVGFIGFPRPKGDLNPCHRKQPPKV